MKHLNQSQRYVISALHKKGFSQSEIAKELGVHKSTISRELKRNVTKTGKYNPTQAQQYAEIRKERFCSNRVFTKTIEQRVRSYLEQEQWSPEQIHGYCKKHQIEMVSVERIYQYIREDKKNGGVLYQYLRHRLKHRKRPVGNSKERIKDRVSIEQRPEKVNRREEFGHWEADLICGKNHQGFLLTLTERVSKMLFICYLPKGKNAKGVAEAIKNTLLPYKSVVHSITMDNGLEFSAHKEVSKSLEADIYFTHPYSSWEKGQIENMNKLIRQYYKKEDIINKDKTMNIKQIQIKINRRPRKNLNYEKPFQLFFKFVNNQSCIC